MSNRNRKIPMDTFNIDCKEIDRQLKRVTQGIHKVHKRVNETSQYSNKTAIQQIKGIQRELRDAYKMLDNVIHDIQKNGNEKIAGFFAKKVANISGDLNMTSTVVADFENKI